MLEGEGRMSITPEQAKVCLEVALEADEQNRSCRLSRDVLRMAIVALDKMAQERKEQS